MKIAYITNCFGTQSHTFIRREIEHLKKLEINISLFGIREDARADSEFKASTRYLYPLSATQLISANLASLARNPLYYFKGAVGAFCSPELSIARRSKMLFHYFASATLYKELKSQGITQLHAHFMNVSASIGLYAAYHARIPASITVHSAGTFGTPHILGIPQKLNAANRLLMISHYNINYFNQFASCNQKSHVVRCGMDLENFPYSPKNINRKKPLDILAVGRFVEKKGFTYLVRAAKIAKQQGLDLRIRIVGDGPLRESIEASAEGTNIEFLGQQPTHAVREAMLESDIVVIPSVTSESGEMEGLPVVIMEAMAIGRTVIATQHAGIPEIVIEHETGLLVPEKSPEDIVAALRFIIDNHCERKLTDNARQLIESEFNIATVAKQRRDIFQQIEHERA